MCIRDSYKIASTETSDNIIANHDQSFNSEDRKNFQQPTLVFITPWHSKGYDLTKKYAQKIDYVSPVWFNAEIKDLGKGGKIVEIEGDHNVDKKYIADLKATNPDIKLIPRIYLPADKEINQEIVRDHTLKEMLVKGAGQIVQRFDFDGILFDSPFIMYIGMMGQGLFELLESMSTEIRENQGKIFMLSLLWNYKNIKGTPSYLPKLLRISDKLLLCMYDYAGRMEYELPISPFSWVSENLQFVLGDLGLDSQYVAERLLMGVPFYGYTYNKEDGQKDAIVNMKYMQVLKYYKPEIKWNRSLKECIIEIDRPKENVYMKIYYPCLKFLIERMRLFEENEVGMFIWEGGQGLDYFYELF
eukprot:TRINITY_DN7123_c0_g1_i1.p1 TRINITY_DN7123_c0_g1~~TRINITY_DN7123_c0_g1_i1.p1  ORF type:complete len:401 (-),score=88.59 TRINITY_DN7123_c0_g1_i1:261-1334(-)